MEFRTKRLYIRPVCIDDKESIFRYRSDSETYKYLSLIPDSVDDVAKFISKVSLTMDKPGTWFQLVIFEQDTHILIGDIGIHFLETDPENKQVEIGYTLDREFRGKGYATEALSMVIDGYRLFDQYIE